ncbi:hypothetical protein [Candidatus Liberibacter africanus]|nr:hypothetical protein [Candidatus Liberibacter africanus]
MPRNIKTYINTRKNMWPVAGIDEVGRGAIAGPVVVADIILV